jgi:hypothetical protein
MSGFPPVVRHMMLCQEVQADPHDPSKVSLIGIVNAIHSQSDPPFPCQLPLLCVYLQLTGGRGDGQVRITVAAADTGEVIFATPSHQISFVADPVVLQILKVKLKNCVYPRPGVYWVQFWYDEEVLVEVSLVLR